MNWFNNRSIRTKLAAAFLLLIGLGGALGGFATARLSAIDERVDTLTQDALPGIARSSEMGRTTGEIRRCMLGVLLATTLSERRELRQQVEEQTARLSDQIAAYNATITSGAEQALLDEFLAAWTAYQRIQD